MEKTDMLIIGGGPAGLGLAKNLSEAGVSFILLEEHKDFFQKACGEGLGHEDCGYDIMELYGSKAGIENKINTFSLFLNSKLLISAGLDGFMLDKREFEKEMFRQATNHGGDVRLGQRAVSFERTANGIIARPQDIECKCLVGCDGAFSKTREFFGQKINGMAFAVAAYEKKNEDDHDMKFYIGKDVINRGYAWRFPKKDTYNVGVGSVRKETVMPAYNRLFNAKGVRGAFIPSSMPCRTHFNNGILVGDSAAQTDALTGGGMSYDLICSKLAADVLTKISKTNGQFSEQNLKEYETLWKKAKYKQLRMNKILETLVSGTNIFAHETIAWNLRKLLKLFMKT